MQNLQKFYIDGQWVAPQSSKKMPVVNPATEEVIGEVILGNEEDVNIAVKAAKNAFMSFSKTSNSGFTPNSCILFAPILNCSGVLT